MNPSFRITVFAVMMAIAFIMVQGYPTETPTLAECATPADCGLGECCVLGMMRYSTPQCLPMGQVEDFCREDNEPENRTLYYPNGQSVDVMEIYVHVCPCDSGLQCIDNSCSQSDSYDNNYIY